MERYLSLVLDKDAKISLTLEKMKDRELDEFIIKNFNSSEEIRIKYAHLVEPYLRQHEEFITETEEKNNRKYRGSIVITEIKDDLTVKRKRVLYKKDIRLFKEITKNKKFILALEKRDYLNYRSAIDNDKKYDRIFSDYFATELRFRMVSDKKFNRVMGQWRNAIKEYYKYYDLIRRTLKEYENRYKELGLDSPTVVYSKYLANKNSSIEINDNQEFADALKRGDRHAVDLAKHISDYSSNPVIVEPFIRYKSHADEEDYPGDLEKWDNSQISTEELLGGEEKGRTKTLHNGHSMLFEFED